MKSLRNLPLQTRRDAWVEINLDAIEANARAIRKRLPPNVAVMAILKADAYGHGAVMVAPTLEASGVSMLGVAAIDEAIQLRQAGVKLPILVIGVVPDWAVQVAAEYDIQLTVFDPHHLESLQKAFPQTRKPIQVHVKVDTGMHRIGVPWEKAAEFIRHCQSLECIEVVGVFSHLADSLNPDLTQPQLQHWTDLCRQLAHVPSWLHIANSGYALAPHAFNPEVPHNLARLGYAFFGYGAPAGMVLRPAMSIKARIMHIQDVPPETGISYGHQYRTPAGRVSRIATLPLGYADGIPRCLSGQIEGLLAGHRVPQVGVITMDQMMFDVSALPDVAIGDTVVLIGEEQGTSIWLDDWAVKAHTIPYELMCALRVRLPKTYTR